MPSLLQLILFLSIVVSVMGGLHYYFYRRLVQNTKLPAPWHRMGTGIIVTLAVVVFATMPAARTLPLSVTRMVTPAPFFWMGAMVFLLASLLVADGIRWIYFGFRKWTGKNPISQAQNTRASRWVAVVSVGVTLVLGSVALVNGKSQPQTKRIEVTLNRLDPVFDGLSIVQLTDLHIGPTIGREWLEKVVATVNALEPDMVVITGDLVDGPVEQLGPEVSPLSNLRSPLGKFFVTGNHEFFSGADEWKKEMSRIGFHVLSDETKTVRRGDKNLVIAGVDDFGRRDGAKRVKRDLRSALSSLPIDEASEAILLLHNPRNMLNLRDDRFGLVLTGHTHGGQIWPFSYLVRIAHPYLRGMYQHHGRTKLYVSEGTGYWGPPLRLGTTAEITHIRLRNETETAYGLSMARSRIRASSEMLNGF